MNVNEPHWRIVSEVQWHSDEKSMYIGSGDGLLPDSTNPGAAKIYFRPEG